MRFGRTNVNKYLVGEQRRNPEVTGEFSMLISDVVRSCKAISQSVSLGKLILREGDVTTLGRHDGPQTDLKKMANQIFAVIAHLRLLIRCSLRTLLLFRLR